MIDRLAKWAEEQLRDHDASHDAIHAANVARLSEWLMATDLPATRPMLRDAVLVVAWTHDICDAKYVSNKASKIDEIVAQCALIGFDDQTIGLVRQVVGLISFSARLCRIQVGASGDPPELHGDALTAYRVVSDADMLEAMGATGVIRTFMYQAVKGQTSYSAGVHIREKLLKCRDHLYHAAAQKEGATRHEQMKLIVEALDQERCPL